MLSLSQNPLSTLHASPRADRRSQLAGFTLLELMIVLAIVALLAVIALPSFDTSIKRNSISSARQALVSGLSMARSEAVSRKVQTVICASDDGAGCGGLWSEGWIVFADHDASSSYSASSDVLLDTHYGLSAIAINSVADRYVFVPSGAQRSPGNFNIHVCDARSSSTVPGKAFRLSSTGAIRQLDAASC